MNLEEINYIAQIVGVVAILGTFAALLFQIRQTNRLLRNQAERAQIGELKSMSEAIYQTPGLAEIVSKLVSEGFESLTSPERVQCMAFQSSVQRTWEGIFVQYRAGLIDGSLWQSHLRQARAAVNETPFIRQHWLMRREFYMPEYRDFFETEVLGNSGSDTLGLGDKEAAADGGAPPPAAAPGNDGAAA